MSPNALTIKAQIFTLVMECKIDDRSFLTLFRGLQSYLSAIIHARKKAVGQGTKRHPTRGNRPRKAIEVLGFGLSASLSSK
jgi:hypothetical protein